MLLIHTPRSYMKAFVWGFIFGTLGLYVLVLFALALPTLESFTHVLTIPGRTVAEKFIGPEGNNIEVLLLTIFNGIVYGILFTLIRLVLNLGNGRT